MKKKAESLVEAISDALKSRGLPARKVSLDAGLSESAIKHILRGTSDSPKVDTVARIARAASIPFFISFDGSGFIPGDLEKDGSYIIPAANGSPETLDNSEETAWIGLWRDMNESQRRMALAMIQAAINSAA